MKFFQKNSWAILLLVGAILSEYLHTWVGVNTYHSTYTNAFGEILTVSLSDAVYYFVHSIFTLFIIIVIFVHIDRDKLASMVIMTGITTWFLIELIEAYCYLKNVNKNMVQSNEWSGFQILVVLLSLLFAFYGFQKYKQ